MGVGDISRGEESKWGNLGKYEERKYSEESDSKKDSSGRKMGKG